ncbi:MAG: DsbA family oxidoreductase, partial [Bacteroidota bacterium]|nr:DsbA family oxidoreductase [Bacteroidota bacterium]
KGIYEFLQESKGLRRDQAEGMTQHVTNMAKEVGLTFDFDKIVVANSFDAHRFIHFAAQQGLQNEAEEKLFAAYFEQGKNVEDHNVLAGIGEELGLDIPKLKEVLIGDAYVQDVKADIQEAQNLNITGVPFFVLNRKYGISGAQPVNIFLEVLEKAYKDEIQQMEVTAEGNSCKDDNC